MWLSGHRSDTFCRIIVLVFFLGISEGQIFSEEPESKLIPLNSEATAVFSCRAGNELTNPTYSWRKDGDLLEIPVDNSGRLQLYTGELHITKPQQSDAGKYMCIINSDQGTATSNNVELAFSYLNQNPSPETSTLDVALEEAILKCGTVDYSPEYSVYFLWEDDEARSIHWQGTKEKFISQKTGNLYFANPKVKDAGTYQCAVQTIGSVNNQKGRASGDKWVLQVYQESKTFGPKFMLQPEVTTYAKLNGRSFIECFASGNPTPNITWTKDGGPLPSYAQVSESGQVYFVDVPEEAEGRYTCTAANTLGSISISGDLVLKYPPVWYQQIESQSHDLGDTFTWTCKAKAAPVASYKWFKNGVSLESSGKIEVVTVGENGDSTLTITNVTEDNAGIYQCFATNNLGNVVSNANLVVNSYEPVIEPEVKSVTNAALGGEATILCQHTAAPAASVQWTKNGGLDVIVPSIKHTILSDGSLEIHDVTADDEGEYTCTLENILGKDSSSGHLKAYTQTRLTRPPEDTYTEVGDDVSLTCEATKDDALTLKWEWCHDGERITIQDSAYDLNGGTLTINSPTSKESGMYKCCAETAVSEPCAAANVYVTAPPDAPTDVIVQGTTQDSQALSWTEPFANYDNITSYTIKYQNSYLGKWRTAKTDPQIVVTTSCKVVGLLPYNDYVYKVIANNGIGSSQASELSKAASTLRGAPAKAPSKLHGGGGEPGQLVVTWKPMHEMFYGSDSVGYKVAVKRFEEQSNNSSADVEGTDEDESSDWKRVTINDKNAANYTFTVDLSEVYVKYEAKIRAFNDEGTGPWSQTHHIRTFELAPDISPPGVKVEHTEAYMVRIAWKELPATTGRIDGYNVKVSLRAGPENDNKEISVKTAIPVATVNNLQANTVYDVVVAGFNSAGEGPWSEPFTFNTAKKPPSHAPTDVQVSIKGTVVTADWTPIVYGDGEGFDEEPLLGYKVQYWQWNRTKVIHTHTTTNTHYQFTVRNNTKFNMVVRGYSNGGDGVSSQTFYLSTESTAAPGFIHCCGANAVRFNSAIIMVVTLLWMLFIKLDL